MGTEAGREKHSKNKKKKKKDLSWNEQIVYCGLEGPHGSTKYYIISVYLVTNLLVQWFNFWGQLKLN